MSAGRHPFEPPRLIRLAVPALRYTEILTGLDRRLPGAGPRAIRRLANYFEQHRGAGELTLSRGAENVLRDFWLDVGRQLSQSRSEARTDKSFDKLPAKQRQRINQAFEALKGARAGLETLRDPARSFGG